MSMTLSSSLQKGDTPSGTRATLPWNAYAVEACDLRGFLSDRLGGSAVDYLPQSITLFCSLDVPVSWRIAFIEDLAVYLAQELKRRQERALQFSNLKLFSVRQLQSFLTDRTDAEPWALFYSPGGGLETSAKEGLSFSQDAGVIPCSTMQNHGVAWKRSTDGELHVWLATAPKAGGAWDWDSDIGHESAHAAFAPVPLFVQPSPEGAEPAPLSHIRRVSDLEPAHMARICYLFAELAVVAVRGEPRPTDTQLPVADRDELFALLSLVDEIIPNLGFEDALQICQRANGYIHPNEGFEIYQIAAPIMRCVARLSAFVNAFHPPDLGAFRAQLIQ